MDIEKILETFIEDIWFAGIYAENGEIKFKDNDELLKAKEKIKINLSLPVEAQVSQENGGLTIQQALLADKPLKRKGWTHFYWIRQWQKESRMKIFIDHITNEDILATDWEIKI